MKMFHERKYYLRLSDFDCRKDIRPSSVLDIFQEIAVEHAEILGIGMETMLEKDLMWVMTKLRYKVIQAPSVSTWVTAKTWPLAPTRIGFQREYLISDIDGNVLIKGSTEWVLMNSATRRFARVSDILSPDAEYLAERNFPGRFLRVADFDETDTPCEFTPGFSHIDVNGHVSNIRYADYVLDAAEPAENEHIDTFRIDFHREILKGSSLSVYTQKTDTGLLAKGMNDAGETMFSCDIGWRMP